MAGLHIALEGGEGVGKSTIHRRLLKDFLGLAPEAAKLYQEPGGTPAGRLIRQFILSEDSLTVEERIVLFTAQRIILYTEVVRPRLEAGELLFFDRSALTGLVYQGFAERPMAFESFLMPMTLLGLRDDWPDLTLLLDAPTEVSLARVEKRGEVRNIFDAKDRDFHERVRQGYLSYHQRWSDRIQLIDATQPPDAVYADVLRILKNRYDLTPAALP